MELYVLYFKTMPNSINFYKGILLHVIPVRIIVPWFKVHLPYNEKELNIKNIVFDPR